MKSFQYCFFILIFSFNLLAQSSGLNTDRKKLDLTASEKEYLKTKKVIKLCIDPLWMPFEKNDNGEHIGMTGDYFAKLEKILNIPIQMLPTQTWSESVRLGKSRACDIFSLMMSTPDRLKYLNFTKPYLKVPLVIVTDIKTPFISEISSIHDREFGIVEDYAFEEILRNKYPNMKLVKVKNIHDGLEKVDQGKLFGFVGALTTVGYHIQKSYIGQLKIASKFDEFWDLGIGTRLDEPILNDIFDKAIGTFTSREHQEILSKWVFVNYEKSFNYLLFFKIIGVFGVVFIWIVLWNRQLQKKVSEGIQKYRNQKSVLIQQSKMASMGEMLGIIAHQWRQPLNIIALQAQELSEAKAANSYSVEEFKLIENTLMDQVRFMSDTIDDFQNFYRPSETETIFYLFQAIDEIKRMIQPLLSDKGVLKLFFNFFDSSIFFMCIIISKCFNNSFDFN